MNPPEVSPSSPTAPQLSIVVPALNEQDNVGPLVEQVDAALRQRGVDVELIVVDDGSTDATRTRLMELRRARPWLTVIARKQSRGQSAAMFAGIAAARAPFVATLDADLQNDPADLYEMYRVVSRGEADMVQGDRSHNRRDNLVRRCGSVVGRKFRLWLLGDPVRDTGCSARVMSTALARQIPLQFMGMHRFFPAYVRVLGGRIVEQRVNHRPRTSGQTKYGLGILSRGPRGLFDCLAVRWMAKRWRDTLAEALEDERNGA